ncbi:MAG: hypothetical protein J0M04_16370 [Verrucomicrobia bacterium]|nr:hypothetical protein [Verrucomicrobiota bacterium]
MKSRLFTTLGVLLLAPSVSAIIDTNNNGLSDLWERAYNNDELFGETFDPQADPDADGWTNAQEAAAGTDPFDPNPPDGLVRPETAHIPAVYGPPDVNGIPELVTPEAVTVTWPTLVGKQYTLLFSPDLAANSWFAVGAPYIGNGNDFVYGFETNDTDSRFWRVAVTDVDTDNDGLADIEEATLGSSPYLMDTDGDGIDDAAARAAGKNPAGDGTDADGDGVPDNELYSVVFEIQQESHEMPYGVGFTDFYGTDDTHRYLTYQESEEYAVSDSPHYSSISDGSQVWKSTHLVGGTIPAGGQPVSTTEGTAFSDWKSAHQLPPLGQDEYLVEDPTETTVDGPTFGETEIVTTTTETTAWRVKRHVAGNPQGQLVRSGTETVTVTERFKLTDPVTYPEFWTAHVKTRPWTETPAATYGPLEWVDYNRTCMGDAQAAEFVRERFRNADFGVSGHIAEPGTAPIADYGYDERLKRVRWRWVRFNPRSPFGYEYASPPADYHQNFHFLVTQHEYLDYRDADGSSPITDETEAKAVIAIACDADHGSGDWQEIPLATFNAHGIEDPANLQDLDFSKWGGSRIWFGTHVDMDFIKPGTEKDDKPVELAAAKEDAEGEVVNVNWDDDDNSEGNGGHGILVFKNDYDDTAANAQEDDMIQLKLRPIHIGYGVPVAKARLKFDDTFVRIWRNQDRTGPILSEETEIELATDQTLYLEGRKLTGAETPEEIEMQLKLGSGGYVPGDTLKVHVATPVITCTGKHNWTFGAAARNLAKQLHDKNYLGARRRDDRNNTVILKGKDQQGKVLWYSVDMVDLKHYEEGDNEDHRPLITVRAAHKDKEMKMALAMEGAHVIYNGHSNYGLGPNFNVGGTLTVDDYMNISGNGMTAITMKSDDPDDALFGGNPMKNPDHGGPDFALRPADLVPSVANYMVPVPGVPKFGGQAIGAVLTPKTDTDGTHYHYIHQGTHKNWNTIVKSAGDKPALRYASCFMASCNSGRGFSESLNHGTLVFTMSESYSILGGSAGQIAGDWFTKNGLPEPNDNPGTNSKNGYSWKMTHYVRLLTEGKSWAQIVSYLNQNQYYPPGLAGPETPVLYKYHTY